MSRPSCILLCLLGLLSACARPAPSDPTPEPVVAPEEARLQFEEVALPASPQERQAVRASSRATWKGRDLTIGFQTLFRVGDVLGDSAPYGQILDIDGRRLRTAGDEPLLCNGLDGATLLQVEDRLWSVVHGECQPGVVQLSELQQDPQTGRLTPTGTRSLDLAGVGGASLLCAAEVTPWMTHLAAEEYDADVRGLQPDGTLVDNHEDYNLMARYHRGDLRGVSPYRNGWMDELVVAADGSVEFHKRFAMGRFSHELGRVMPDRRTVYLSDDGTNSGFFVFVADRPDDLSAGRLYGSVWTQLDEAGRFELGWVDLGHAADADIAAELAAPPAFDALFEAADPVDGACPDGLERVVTSHERGCLRLKEGRAVAASRLETRRYAALLGVTTELRKAEGMALDRAGRRLFLAMSKIERGMLPAHDRWDHPGADHVRMEPNRCGVVFELALAEGGVTTRGGEAIDSPWMATTARVVVEGRPADYEGELAANRCDLDAMANPDNLAFIDEAGLLVIAEDSKFHENNALWAIDVDSGAATRVMTVPVEGEVAGLNWFGDVGGWGYLTVSVQHSEQPPTEGRGAPQDPRSWTGVLGPFPRLE